MKISNLFLIKPLRQVPKWLLVGIAIAAFAGFLDSSYLTVQHYRGAAVPCSIVEGCEEVLNSPYSEWKGMPVSLFGAVYYLAVFVLLAVFFDSGRTKILSFLARFAAVGLLASLYFLYLQLFVIGAVCLYCLGSATTSVLLFVLGILLVRREFDY